MNTEQVHRQSMEKQVKAFTVLSEINQEIAGAADQDESAFYDFICRKLGLLGIENFFFATYEEITDAVQINSAVREGERVDVSKQPGWKLEKGNHEKLKKVIMDGSILQLNSQENGFSSVLNQLDKSGKVVNSCCSVPLAGGKIRGILVQYFYDDDKAFDEDDEMILQSIANILAIAMDKQRVKKERNQLRYLIDNIPGCYIYIKDRESRFVVANEAVARIMRQESPKDVIGKNDFDFYDKEEAQGYYNDEQDIIQRDEPVKNIEEFSTDPEGNDRITLTTKAPFHDAEGKITGTFGIGRDVTELRANENLLRTLIDSVPDHIYAKNTEHKFTLANKTVIEYTPEVSSEKEIIGKTDRDFKRKFFEKYEVDERKVFQEGKKLLNIEERIEDLKTGRDVWLSTTKIPLHNGEKEIIGLVGINRDITKYKKRQEILDILKKLKSDIKLTSKTEDNEEKVLKFLREGATILTKARNSYIALVKDNIIQFILQKIRKTEEGKETVVKVEDRPFRKGKTEYIINHNEYILIKSKKEDEKWYNEHDTEEYTGVKYVSSWLGVPIEGYDKKVLGVIAIYSENDEGKYTEDDLDVLYSLAGLSGVMLENARLYTEGIEKTSELRRYRDQLIKESDAEELFGYFSSLSDTIPILADLIKERSEELIEKIRNNTDIMARDVRSLSDYKALADIDMSNLLKSIVKKITSEYYYEISSNQLELVTKDIPEDLFLIKGSYHLIAKAFFLIIKHRAEALLTEDNKGKVLTITAKNLDEDNKKGVQIDIEDNGSEINEELQKSIFHVQKTGDGLWKAQGYIEKIGGNIAVESRKNGSTFRVSVPFGDGCPPSSCRRGVQFTSGSRQ